MCLHSGITILVCDLLMQASLVFLEYLLLWESRFDVIKYLQRNTEHRWEKCTYYLRTKYEMHPQVIACKFDVKFCYKKNHFCIFPHMLSIGFPWIKWHQLCAWFESQLSEVVTSLEKANCFLLDVWNHICKELGRGKKIMSLNFHTRNKWKLQILIETRIRVSKLLLLFLLFYF